MSYETHGSICPQDVLIIIRHRAVRVLTYIRQNGLLNGTTMRHYAVRGLTYTRQRTCFPRSSTIRHPEVRCSTSIRHYRFLRISVMIWCSKYKRCQATTGISLYNNLCHAIWIHGI